MGSTVHTCWTRAKCHGAFQKFLAYTLLSIACFLSPIHVWQVIFPGSLLVLTSLAYFLLSKKQKEATGNGSQELSGDPCDEVIDEMAEDKNRQTSFFHRKFGSLAGYLRSLFKAYPRLNASMAFSSILSRRKHVDCDEQVEQMTLPLREEP